MPETYLEKPLVSATDISLPGEFPEARTYVSASAPAEQMSDPPENPTLHADMQNLADFNGSAAELRRSLVDDMNALATPKEEDNPQPTEAQQVRSTMELLLQALDAQSKHTETCAAKAAAIRQLVPPIWDKVNDLLVKGQGLTEEYQATNARIDKLASELKQPTQLPDIEHMACPCPTHTAAQPNDHPEEPVTARQHWDELSAELEQLNTECASITRVDREVQSSYGSEIRFFENMEPKDRYEDRKQKAEQKMALSTLKREDAEERVETARQGLESLGSSIQEHWKLLKKQAVMQRTSAVEELGAAKDMVKTIQARLEAQKANLAEAQYAYRTFRAEKDRAEAELAAAHSNLAATIRLLRSVTDRAAATPPDAPAANDAPRQPGGSAQPEPRLRVVPNPSKTIPSQHEHVTLSKRFKRTAAPSYTEGLLD